MPVFKTFFHTRFVRLLDISIQFSDSLNFNFNKDLSNTIIDILELGWNGIKYPENVSEDDTKQAFEASDFVPSYPENFYYGDVFGLLPDNTFWSPILDGNIYSVKFNPLAQGSDPLIETETIFTWW